LDLLKKLEVNLCTIVSTQIVSDVELNESQPKNYLKQIILYSVYQNQQDIIDGH